MLGFGKLLIRKVLRERGVVTGDNTFLQNHVSQLSIDFFIVPTIRFQTLYVFLVLAHDRRRVIHFNVTQHPTAEWTGQQMRNAFPDDKLPCCLLRDRDGIFGQEFREQVQNMGITEVPHAESSQSPAPYTHVASTM